jgi:glycine/D-amino acid oxidase-like deaminating enzyme/nitrite reductase/ring-hydroxylating ferredoxin subunit
MFRDGARKSMWQAEAKRFENLPTQDQLFDVAIVGGGITGVSTAYRLQLIGLKCILLDANNIGFGTTGGTTAHLNDFFDTTYKEAINKFGLENAKLLAQAGKEAINIVHSNVFRHAINCDFEYKNAHLFAVDDDQVKQLDDIVDGAIQVGYEMNYLDQIDFPIPFKKAVLIPKQAQFHPLKYIKGLTEAYIQAGGMVVESCMVESHVEDHAGVVLKTSLGDINAKHAVYATHTPPGISILHFTTAPYRSYAIAFSLKNGNYPNTLGYDLYDPYHYYRTHEIDGKQLLIAGGEDHKTGHSEDTGSCFAELENYCRSHFDVDTVEYAWSSQYFEPADGLPSIGVLPSSDGRIFVATGFRGNGMTFGTLSSAIISDLIIDGENPYAKLFNPKRFKPTAGFTSFVKENATVVSDFIKDKISIERIQSLAEINEGEAKVVKYEGDSYAIYAEQNGQLHVLKSTCPHAKCEVRWNNAELSWDCPCHGSRFNINGRILTGPATSGLEKLNEEL